MSVPEGFDFFSQEYCNTYLETTLKNFLKQYFECVHRHYDPVKYTYYLEIITETMCCKVELKCADVRTSLRLILSTAPNSSSPYSNEVICNLDRNEGMLLDEIYDHIKDVPGLVHGRAIFGHGQDKQMLWTAMHRMATLLEAATCPRRA
jgi:hypothetical protein